MNKLIAILPALFLTGCVTMQPMESGDFTPNASVYLNYPHERALESLEVWKSRCQMSNGNYGGMQWAILPPMPTYRWTTTFIPNNNSLLIVKSVDSVNPLAICDKNVCGVMSIYRMSPDKEGTRLEVRTKVASPKAGQGALRGLQKVIESGGIAGMCIG